MEEVLVTIISKIFEIVGVSEEKAKRDTGLFLVKVMSLAVAYLIDQQPEEQQQPLITEFKTLKTPEQVSNFIKNKFEEERVGESVLGSFQVTTEEYFESIGPTLTPIQKEQIYKALLSISKIKS